MLLDSVPEGVNYFSVGRAIEAIPGVNRVHDLHVWTMSPGHGAIQCHVHIESPECWPKILDVLRRQLHEEFQIDHVTVQPEWDFRGSEDDCEVCRNAEFGAACRRGLDDPKAAPAAPVLDAEKLLEADPALDQKSCRRPGEFSYNEQIGPERAPRAAQMEILSGAHDATSGIISALNFFLYLLAWGSSS